MGNVLTVSVALIPLAPFLAGVAALIGAGCGSHWAKRGVIGAMGCGCSFAASLAACRQLLLPDDGTEPRSWELFRWLDAAGLFPIKVSFGLQIDELSAAMLAATSLVAFVSTILALFAPHDDKAARPDLLVAPFLVAGAAMLLLSPSVLQLFFFWQATALVTFAAGAGLSENPLAAAASRKAFLIGRVGDVALVFGMLLFWHHFRTPDWIDVLTTPSSIETDTERLHALAAVGLCFLGSVVARCAQFPLLGWLEDVAATSPPRVLLWEAVVLLPTGVYVIARFAGIMAASESLQLLASFVGGVTAFLAALSAVYATDSRRAVAYASASLVGWMLLGFGSGESSGVIGATRLLLFHTLGMGAFLCAWNGPNAARRTLVVSTLFLTSGFWGQSAILSALWDAAISPAGSAATPGPLGSERKGVFLILLCLETLALFLLALGMFRILFESGGDRDSRNETSIPIPRRRAIWVIPVMLISAAIVLSPVWVDGPGMIEQIFLRVWPNLGDVPKIDFFSIALGLAPALAGIVCAWMKFGPGVRPAAQQSTMFPGVARWNRNRYYLEDFFVLSLLLPIRALAQLSRFFDWFLIDGLLVQIPARFPSEVARLARPLEQGAARLYALGIFLATAVLLAAVLWLRG